jgi:FkbM family methyltransferase
MRIQPLGVIRKRLRSTARATAWAIGEAITPLQRLLSRQRSYSQEGEDLVLLRYFNWRSSGFYIDVGAHHPFRYSNTQCFYERGWRGINIDASPGSMQAFYRCRRRDINLEVGVGESATEAKFFVFNDPAFNTFDEAVARRHETSVWHVERVIDVAVVPLRDLLKKHVPEGQSIDFMSIDVEGRDLEVLRSNDWEIYRPKVVLSESIGSFIDDINTDNAALFLRSVGYIPFAKFYNTLMFVQTSDT